MPLFTAQDQINWLKENLRGHLKPELIIWTGDSASHSMEYMDEKEIVETVRLLTLLLKETFPDIPIVFSIGNHDFEPSNTQDFDESETEFLKKINDFWVDTLPDHASVKS